MVRFRDARKQCEQECTAKTDRHGGARRHDGSGTHQCVGGSYGTLEMVGTPRPLPTKSEEWLITDACDGFNVMFPYLPAGLDDVVDRVVPELRAVPPGIKSEALKENLGLHLAHPTEFFRPAALGLAFKRKLNAARVGSNPGRKNYLCPELSARNHHRGCPVREPDGTFSKAPSGGVRLGFGAADAMQVLAVGIRCAMGSPQALA